MRIYNIVLAAWVGLTLATAVGVAFQRHQIDNLESVLNQQEVRLGIVYSKYHNFSIEAPQSEEMSRLHSDNTTMTGPAFKHYEQPSITLTEEEAKELMIDFDDSAFSRPTEIFIEEGYGIETIYIGDFKLSLQGFPLEDGEWYEYKDGRLRKVRDVIYSIDYPVIRPPAQGGDK